MTSMFIGASQNTTLVGADIIYLQQLQQEYSNSGLLLLTQGTQLFPYDDVYVGRNLESLVLRDCLWFIGIIRNEWVELYHCRLVVFSHCCVQHWFLHNRCPSTLVIKNYYIRILCTIWPVSQPEIKPQHAGFVWPEENKGESHFSVLPLPLRLTPCPCPSKQSGKR